MQGRLPVKLVKLLVITHATLLLFIATVFHIICERLTVCVHVAASNLASLQNRW